MRLSILLLAFSSTINTGAAAARISNDEIKSLMPPVPREMLATPPPTACRDNKILQLPQNIRKNIPKKFGVKKLILVPGKRSDFIAALLAPVASFDCPEPSAINNDEDSARFLQFWQEQGNVWRSLGTTPAWSWGTYGFVDVGLIPLSADRIRFYQNSYLGGTGFSEDSYFEVSDGLIRRIKWFYQAFDDRGYRALGAEKMSFLEQHPELCSHDFTEDMVDFLTKKAERRTCELFEKMTIETREHIVPVPLNIEVNSPFLLK